MRHAQITIDVNALRHNFARVKQLAPNSKVLAMVKANAYGIGLDAALLAFGQDADGLGVACLQEARELRNLGYTGAITLVEGIFDADEMRETIALACELLVHRQQQVDWLLQYQHVYRAAGLKVWVKLNSGMNRLGFSAMQAIALIQQLQNLGFDCVLTMHFANADDPLHPLNQQQIAQLLSIKAALPSIKVSCCNSAAIYHYPNLHFDYVRPGIMLYGASPFADLRAVELGLQTVHTLTAKIIALHDLQQGDAVGYGSLFVTEKPTRVAVVSIGYGDGYPRVAIEQNYVVISQQLCPIVGRVSMDMLTVDVTHLHDSLQLGTAVELWGKQRDIDEVARTNGTIGYELLCRMTQRPQRKLIHT